MLIDAVEAYEAVLNLCKLLIGLNIDSGKELSKHVVKEYGDEFERCDQCAYTKSECECDADYGRASIYNDEASFDE
jgi:hypothetical protein